jgi:predicted RNA methylase
VPKRASPVELKELVKSSGFTPSVRDVPGLFTLLEAEVDDVSRREVERALERVGPAALALAVEEARGAKPPLRARLCRLIGRLANGDAVASRFLLDALTDPDGKTRRSAALALGKSRTDPAIETALLDAWVREKGVEHHRSIAQALGNVGGTRALELLRSVHSEDRELQRLVQRAVTMLVRDQARADLGGVDGARLASAPVSVSLHCRAGLEAIVLEEVGARCGSMVDLSSATVARGVVRVDYHGPLDALFAVRTMTHFAFPLPPEATTVGSLEDAVVRSLASDLAKSLLETWSGETVRFRLAWADGRHRRAATWRCVHKLADKRPAWVNDPVASTWEAVVEERRGVAHIELVPRALRDPRFVYRVRDVPAASNPTLAAALVRIAGVRADDVVWDPFVGSGTELVERALAGPYAELHGSDGDPRALDAARANFDAAGLRSVNLQVADATSFAPAGVTLIITNPPMGRRVARADSLPALFDRFIDHAARVLARHGRLVWISPRASQTAARAKALGLSVDLAEDVDMGGFTAMIQRITKA